MSLFAQRVLFNLGLSQHVARVAASECIVAGIDAKQVIWGQGSRIGFWDLVISGVVAVSQGRNVSDCRLVHFFGDGAWYGEQFIINETPSQFIFHSIDQVDLLRVPAALFCRLMEDEPAFIRFVAKLGAWKNQLFLDANSLLKAGSPSLRVVLGLGLCAENIAMTALPNLVVGSGDSLRIPMKQELLAQYCGVSRTILSKNLQALLAHNLIKIEYSEITMTSVREWCRFVAFLKSDMSRLMSAEIEDLVHAYRSLVEIDERSLFSSGVAS